MRDRSVAADETGTVTGDGVVVVERHSPEAVFALLANDTRVAILQTLGETPDVPVPFAHLFDRVDVSDSGQFNYHLGKLRDSFVRKTDGGYELTHAGRQVVGVMYAGTYATDATVGPIPVDGACPLCDGTMVAEYADETATIACEGCGEWYNEFPFPTGTLDGFDREALPGAFDRWMLHVCRGIVAGFCDVCDGRIGGRLVVDAETAQDDRSPAHVEFECERCASTSRFSAGLPVRFHPRVEGFLFDHGFDTRTDPTWTLTAALDSEDVTVRSTDPPRVEVRFTTDGESVTAVVSDDATVTDVERGPVES